MEWADGATSPILARITTNCVPVAQRPALLSDELGRRLTAGHARILRDVGAEPLIDWHNADLGQGLVLARGRIAGLDVERTAAMARASDGDCTLFVALSAGISFEQNDRRVGLSRGDGLFVTHARAVRSWWTDAHMMLVRLPRAALGPGARVDAAGGLRLPAASEPMALLRPYLLALLRRAEAGAAPGALARRHVAELVGDALAARDEAAGGPRGAARDAARLARMLEYLRCSHARDSLRMRDVAAAVGLSERAGYLLFRKAEIDFAEHLQAIRLDRAYEKLQGTGADGPAILDVALAVGFSDLSHFNRRFRARFDATPSEVRRRHR